MFESFGSDHYIACSFQKTSSVTAHMASQVNPEARFFYLDTDVLFPETYETRDRLAEALGIEFDRFHNLTLEEQAAEYGDELWKSDPDACCGLRKVEPMRRALSSVDCWVAGVRRGDSSSRAEDAEVRLGQEIQPLEAESASPTGPRPTSGTTSMSTTFRTTRFTIAATRRSAAPTARSRSARAARRATVAGPASPRPSAGSTRPSGAVSPERRRAAALRTDNSRH